MVEFASQLEVGNGIVELKDGWLHDCVPSLIGPLKAMAEVSRV